MSDNHGVLTPAASYTRTCEDDDRQDAVLGILEQEQLIEESAARLGCSVISQFHDLRTGGGAARRPGFQQMLTEALSGDSGFQAVIVADLSRFSRIEAELFVCRTQLDLCGIKLISVTGS